MKGVVNGVNVIEDNNNNIITKAHNEHEFVLIQMYVKL